mmetsp:Transcript_30935/g.70710  ORF Transcript_30935/g.70710 Transcript_30935/m.70710 type:complete len:219 (+) Transcript_30935:240-896(+)
MILIYHASSSLAIVVEVPYYPVRCAAYCHAFWSKIQVSVSVYGGNQRQHIIKEYFRCTLPKRDGGILINFHIKEVDEPVSCATFWQASTGKSQPRRHMTPPPERFHRFIVEFSDAFSQLVLALLEFIEPRHLKLKIIRRKARDGSRRDVVMQTFSENVIGTLHLRVVVECQRIGLKVSVLDYSASHQDDLFDLRTTKIFVFHHQRRYVLQVGDAENLY